MSDAPTHSPPWLEFYTRAMALGAFRPPEPTDAPPAHPPVEVQLKSRRRPRGGGSTGPSEAYAASSEGADQLSD
jgi:hypothetical protein